MDAGDDGAQDIPLLKAMFPNERRKAKVKMAFAGYVYIVILTRP